MTQTQITTTPSAESKERILFESRPLVLPTILTLENLILIGTVALAALFSVVFRVGPLEMAIIAVLYLLLAFPSLRLIFMAGSTTYVLTNHRLVIFTFGLRQNEQSIPLTEISEAKCKYSGLQRLYRAGDIIVYRKRLRSPVRLHGVQECSKMAEQINKAVAKR